MWRPDSFPRFLVMADLAKAKAIGHGPLYLAANAFRVLTLCTPNL